MSKTADKPLEANGEDWNRFPIIASELTYPADMSLELVAARTVRIHFCYLGHSVYGAVCSLCMKELCSESECVKFKLFISPTKLA